jgi:preprotein translocase subunit Sec63
MDGMGGMGGRRRKPVDNTSYYKCLGVEKDANVNQIKKAYRKMAMTVCNVHSSFSDLRVASRSDREVVASVARRRILLR